MKSRADHLQGGRAAALRVAAAVAVLGLAAPAFGAAAAGQSGGLQFQEGQLPDNLTAIENKYFRMLVTPLGGRVLSLRAKFIDAELTRVKATAGTFCEYDWMRRNRWFYNDKPFDLSVARGDGEVSLSATGSSRGGGTDFLVIGRKYTLRDDSTSVLVDYTFGNHPNAMSAQDYALLIHTTLGVNGSLCSYYYPSTEGIVEVERNRRPKDVFVDHPSRGWMAAVDDHGRGVALTMPFKDVKSFYSWLSNDAVPTLEWRMIPVSIDEGKSYSVSTEVIVFQGLGRVSGAGGGLVGEISGGVVKVYNCRAGKVLARAGGETRELEFAAPGEVRSFKSDACTVSLEVGGREVCRLEAPPKSGEWAMPIAERQRESSVKGYDLMCHTNFPHQACRPFARPLAVARPRVTAVTGYGNAVEIGFLRDRFDCEVATTQIGLNYASRKSTKRSLRNPIYDSGEHFGKLSVADVEENLLKTLEKDADVILVGGLPWEVFPKAARKAILDKVKSGVGLVWIGQGGEAPEIMRTGRAAKLVREVPKAVGDAFQDVPFALLGKEPVFSFRASGDVHATAGGAAYLAEDVLGKGRVLHLAYDAVFGQFLNMAGLTPDLKDFYPDRIAPVEYYYSLIGKCILRACSRRLPAQMYAERLDGRGAALAVVAEDAAAAVLEYGVRTPFGDLLASGRAPVELRRGRNDVKVDLKGMRRRAGGLAFEAVLRDGDGRVMAWGDWAFAHKPAARISALKADRDAAAGEGYREGESARLTLSAAGKLDGLRVEAELSDSYGRVLARKSLDAAPTVAWDFAISNDLAARAYEVNARLVDASGEIDRRRVELRARPASEKLAWDDFVFGMWTADLVREYLWPERAKLFRQMHLDTNVSTSWRDQIDFASRYGFSPTFKSAAGIGRCGEPPEYAKTGDKMKLVHVPCLSDPEFLASQAASHAARAKRLAHVGIRFVWFGDEQSLTGKGSTAIDFCFSEHCLREFRKFLRARYGSLERLNEEWGTSFAEWDCVVPFTREEVWADGGERHVAGWADHLEFMDGRLANSLARCGAAFKAEDPCIMSSVSGTQAPRAYGGMDWWKQVHDALDGALSYRVGGQFELHRSFRPDGGFMPWAWGYSRRGAQAVDHLWQALFLGCRGIAGYAESSIVCMDWTWSLPYQEVKPAMDRVAAGVGKHFVQNLRPEPEIAVLYSQAAIRAAFFERREDEHMALRDKYIRLLRHLGLSFDFVSYDQLADGTFESRGYKALILPDACAMGDGEVEAVRRFSAAGGTVVAEGVPARRAWNCRPRAESPLVGLAQRREIDVSYLKAADAPGDPENAKKVAAEQDWLEGLLARAGISQQRMAVLRAADGARVRSASVYAKSGRNGARLWGVLSDEAKPAEVRFEFPAEGYVCDLVQGRMLGKAKSVTLPLASGSPHAFEVLREEPRLGDVAASPDGRVSVSYSPTVDTVVLVRVWGPGGAEALHYAKKLVVRDGAAEARVPFAVSDPPGRWRISVEDMLTGEVRNVAVDRAQ